MDHKRCRRKRCGPFPQSRLDPGRTLATIILHVYFRSKVNIVSWYKSLMYTKEIKEYSPRRIYRNTRKRITFQQLRASQASLWQFLSGDNLTEGYVLCATPFTSMVEGPDPLASRVILALSVSGVASSSSSINLAAFCKKHLVKEIEGWFSLCKTNLHRFGLIRVMSSSSANKCSMFSSG